MYDSMDQNENNSRLEEENARLKKEVESLQAEVQRYKVLAEAFEQKYNDARDQITKVNEEMAQLKAGTGSLGAVGSLDYNSENDEVKRIFVGGLSPQTTSESLKSYFSQYGEIIDATVMYDNATQKSRGFGFVRFSDASMVDAAQAARPHKIDNKVVDTKRAVTKAESNEMQALITGKVKRIFIGGLRISTTESMLREYFSKFGAITHVNTFEDRNTKQRKGFAYVTFEDYDTVDKVCQQRFHNIDERRVEVKRAVSKADRQAFAPPATQNMAAVPAAPVSPYAPYGDSYSAGGGAMSSHQGWYSGSVGVSPDPWGTPQMGGGQSSLGPSRGQNGSGWSTGGGSWNVGGYNPSMGVETKSASSIGPMRGGGRFSERSAGPYGSYGAYGSSMPPN